MRELQKTRFDSWKVGALCDGCKLCVEGKKFVLFITGLCNVKCYYCPISDDKYGQDVIYANEQKISDVSEAIEEARLSGATSCGITGGDPLLKINRCIEYIKAFKKRFHDFHIHLYTTLKNCDAEKLKKLYDAGLDEIRFHLKDDFDLSEALKYDWDVGVEVPVVPGENLRPLIDAIEGKVKFLNLNELEMADNSYCELSKFETKDELSYAVKGSEEEARELLKYARDKKINVHFCTARLKNVHQLGNRIKLRAKHVAEKFDEITEDGTLIRGAIYSKVGSLGCPHKREEERVLVSKKDAKKLKKKHPDWKIAVVEEYPTADKMQVEKELL